MAKAAPKAAPKAPPKAAPQGTAGRPFTLSKPSTALSGCTCGPSAVMHGHGAAIAVDVVAAWRQRVGVRVSDSEGDLDRLGVMNEVPLSAECGRPRWRERRSSASWGNTARRAVRSRSGVAGFQLVVQALHQLIRAPAVATSMLLYMCATLFRLYGKGESLRPRKLPWRGKSPAQRHSHRHRRRGHADVHGRRVRQLAEH